MKNIHINNLVSFIHHAKSTMKLTFLRLPSRKQKKFPIGPSSTTDSSETEDLTEQLDERLDEELLTKPAAADNLMQRKAAMTLEERWSDDNFAKVAKLWQLTPEAQTKLLNLKARIADIDHWKNEPHEVVRFLKEHRGNLKKAEQCFRRDHKWRLDHNIDQLLETYRISPLFNYFPIAVLKGLDHDGDPIHLERPGAADCWSFYQRLGPEEIYQMAVYMRELETRGAWHNGYEQQQGRPVKQFTILVDLEGLNANHMRAGLIPLLGRVLAVSQEQYPFFAKRVIILRAPRIFRVLWSIAQHFVHDSVKKLIVFSTPQDYLEVLDQYMDRSVLPPSICPDEGQGCGTVGFEKVRFEGGELPPPEMTDAELVELLEYNQLKDEASRNNNRLPQPTKLFQEETKVATLAKGFYTDDTDNTQQTTAATPVVVCC